MQGAIGCVQPNQVIGEGGEEPFEGFVDMINFQAHPFLDGGQHGSPFLLVLRPGGQGPAQVILQIKGRRGPAAGFHVVEVGEQRVERIPPAGLDMVKDKVVPEVARCLRGMLALPGDGSIRIVCRAQVGGEGPQQAGMELGQVVFVHLVQVIVLQVMQGNGILSFTSPAGQGAIHEGLGQVAHIVLIQSQGCPVDGQHVQGDDCFLWKNDQVHVAGAILFQRVHADVQRGQQVGIGIAGEQALQPFQIGLLQAMQGPLPGFGVLAHERAHHGQGQRQVAALPRHLPGFRRQGVHGLPGPIGQQLQGFLLGKYVQGIGGRVEGVQHALVARGDE